MKDLNAPHNDFLGLIKDNNIFSLSRYCEDKRLILLNIPPIYFIELIKNNVPFSFARYGDGEMILMFNHETVINRDIGDLKKAIEPMKQIFRNHYDYFHCMLRCTFNTHNLNCFGVNIEDVLNFMDENCPDMPFYNGEIWQDYISFSGNINQLTIAINPYKPVFIGGKHLENIQYIDGMSNMDLIVVDDRKAWDDFDIIIEKVRQKISSGSKMFCFSMGYPGKIMIDVLYPEVKNKCFMIDFGSMWDPYCGILSRQGMINVGFQKFQPFTKYQLPI